MHRSQGERERERESSLVPRPSEGEGTRILSLSLGRPGDEARERDVPLSSPSQSEGSTFHPTSGAQTVPPQWDTHAAP